MSHKGREKRRRKTRAEKKREGALGGRRRASFRNNFDPSVKQFRSNFLPLKQKHVGEKKESQQRVLSSAFHQIIKKTVTVCAEICWKFCLKLI